ncbi:MAG: 3-keto-5-aminohexanoate cleavage protein, partial [Anaerolineae bacterium]
MKDRLLVTVAPCIPPALAAQMPGLDLSPEGIAREVVRAANAGANVVHLHVWDERGRPTATLDAFERTIRLIRAECDIIIEGSTGGVNTLTAAERCVSLQADIELASLNPGSVNYDAGVYVNSPADILYWAQEMQRRRIKPDIAIFEAGMIANAVALAEEGWIEPPLLFGFVL